MDIKWRADPDTGKVKATITLSEDERREGITVHHGIEVWAGHIDFAQADDMHRECGVTFRDVDPFGVSL